MNGRTLENVGKPGSDGDAANKKYVDDAINTATSTKGKYPLYPDESPVDSGMLWTNGKKIYRTVIRGTSHTNSGQMKVVAQLPYYEERVSIDGYITSADGNHVPINYYYYDNGFNTTCTINASSGNVQFTWRSSPGSENQLSNKNIVIVAHYTMK